MTEPRRRQRGKLFALAGGVAVASVLVALATGLGGLNIGTIGAEGDSIEAYDGGIDVIWGDSDYSVTAGEFLVDSVTLSPSDPLKPFPLGHSFDVVLAKADGTILHRESVEITTASVTISITSGVSVQDLAKVAVSLEESSVV